MYHSLPRIPSGTCVTSTRMLLHTDNEVLGTLFLSLFSCTSKVVFALWTETMFGMTSLTVKFETNHVVDTPSLRLI